MVETCWHASRITLLPRAPTWPFQKAAQGRGAPGPLAADVPRPLSGDQIVLTHEYIALMLAIRRSSVTTALHVLEGWGFIRSARKLVIVRNRRAMEEFA